MTLTLWRSYVELLAGDQTQSEVALTTGVDQTTVGRWRNGSGKKAPDPGSVAAFCRGYGRSPIEGFIAAGLLDESEGAGALPSDSITLLRTLRTIAEPDAKPDDAYAAARRELLGRETRPSARRRRSGPETEAG